MCLCGVRLDQDLCVCACVCECVCVLLQFEKCKHNYLCINSSGGASKAAHRTVWVSCSGKQPVMCTGVPAAVVWSFHCGIDHRTLQKCGSVQR